MIDFDAIVRRQPYLHPSKFSVSHSHYPTLSLSHSLRPDRGSLLMLIKDTHSQYTTGFACSEPNIRYTSLLFTLLIRALEFLESHFKVTIAEDCVPDWTEPGIQPCIR